MNSDEFYNEIESEKEPNRFALSKKLLITVGIIIAIVIIVLFILLNNNNTKKNSYSLEIEAPSIMYIDEPLAISVKLNCLEKYTEKAQTSFFSTEENIIELPESDFYGKTGTIYITPLAPGKDKINVVSAIGVDKYSKELTKKAISITVCPKFDNSLINEKEITIKKGFIQNLNIEFGEKECSEIITYETDNSSILSVTQDGNVKGLTPGKAKIIISNGSNDIEVLVNVID